MITFQSRVIELKTYLRNQDEFPQNLVPERVIESPVIDGIFKSAIRAIQEEKVCNKVSPNWIQNQSSNWVSNL